VKPKVWFKVVTIESGDDAYIKYYWNSWNATSCVASGGWRNGNGANDTFIGPKALSYSQEGWAFNYSTHKNPPPTSLTLSCTGPGGTTSVTLNNVTWNKHNDNTYEDTKYE
jgi:hypothetical protein